jgi:hypothetical protein
VGSFDVTPISLSHRKVEMRVIWLAVILVAIIAVQVVTLQEAFAATSPGTMVNLAANRPIWMLAAAPARE